MLAQLSKGRQSPLREKASMARNASATFASGSSREIGSLFRRAANSSAFMSPNRGAMIAAEIESWPQPAHNVLILPS